MSARLQIALLRAKYAARHSMRRAVEILLAARIPFEWAARFVASLLAPRVPA